MARDALKCGRLQGGVVGTLMTNLALENALAKLGIPFARSKVGDRYVMELLQQKGWAIGGESSGHILNLNLASTGDGMVAGLQVITAMLRANMNLHDLSSGFEKYPQTLINVRYDASAGNPLEDSQVAEVTTQAEASLGKTGRVLLRKSGTEPLLRVMVEAQESSSSKNWAEKIAEVVRKVAN